MKALMVALLILVAPCAASADNLDVSVVTVKKFTILKTGGVEIPPGRDSYWDFLEITNNDESRPSIVITGVGCQNCLGGVSTRADYKTNSEEAMRNDLISGEGCILTGDTKFPISLPYKTTLEFTIRQGCGVGGVAIDVDVDGGIGGAPHVQQQRYVLTDKLMRLASPVFQVRFQRSN
jgi:hypothetical protein